MPNYMEENLNMPLYRVLEIIQKRIMSETTYHGIPSLQSPMDFWIYQEIIFETKPDVIIEIGTNCGAGTLSLAHICDLIGGGRVIGLDISHEKVPKRVREHPRITLVEGDACQSFNTVKQHISK